MKRILLSLTALMLLAGCGAPKTENSAETQQNTPPQALQDVVSHDIVESGSSMWGGGRLGTMGMTKTNIDSSGLDELLLLDPGPSDGEFKLMITAAEDDENYTVKYQTVYESPICKVDFVEKDGKTVLEYRRYQVEKDFEGSHYEDPTYFDEPHYFDIELKNDNIILTENGEPFSKIAVQPVIAE